MRRLFLLLSLLALNISARAGSDPLWDNRGCVDDARGQWFRAAKFGAFIHFGLYSSLGGYYQGKGPYDPAEQIMGLGERHQVIPWQVYETNVGGAFNPTNFDAHEWVAHIKNAGQKYLIVTAKHHDGFCMFRTATTHYNVVEQTPFQRDVIRELCDECRRQGITFCPYYSIGDWAAADVMDPKFKSYKDYMFAQLKELLTQYGDIRMLWLDNYWYVNGQWKNDEAHARELYDYLRTINPNILVNDRCGSGARSTDGDYATPENQLAGSRQSRYFEVVMTDTDDDNWGWVRTAQNYRSASDILHNLIDSTSKGGNFVLNVGPMGDGAFPPQHLAIIDETGRWLGINGESIYDASPAPECKFDSSNDFVCCATKKGNAIYLQVLKWPGPDATRNVTIQRSGLQRAEFLDPAFAGQTIAVASSGDVTTVALRQPASIDPNATVIKLTFAPNP